MLLPHLVHETGELGFHCEFAPGSRSNLPVQAGVISQLRSCSRETTPEVRVQFPPYEYQIAGSTETLRHSDSLGGSASRPGTGRYLLTSNRLLHSTAFFRQSRFSQLQHTGTGHKVPDYTRNLHLTVRIYPTKQTRYAPGHLTNNGRRSRPQLRPAGHSPFRLG